MTKPVEQSGVSVTNRREFFRDVARAIVVGGVALATAALVAKRPGRPSEAPCINQGICRRCSVLGACGLPAALSTKHALARS